MNQKRQPKGIPIGGRYAENSHDEAGGVLTTPTDSSDLAAIDAELVKVAVYDFDGIEDSTAPRSRHCRSMPKSLCPDNIGST